MDIKAARCTLVEYGWTIANNYSEAFCFPFSPFSFVRERENPSNTSYIILIDITITFSVPGDK